MRTGMIISLLSLVLMPGFVQAHRTPKEELLARADASFRKGIESKARLLESRKHFSDAVEQYKLLEDRSIDGLRTAGLYQSLGNAAMLADRWPEAIWAYQCGLRLNPNDRTMRQHLAFARAKVLYPPAGQGRPERETWPDWLHRPTVNDLIWIGGLSYVLLSIAGTGAVLTRRRNFVALTIVLGIVTAGAAVGLLHELRQAELDRESRLVVLVSNADFHRGNATSYPKHLTTPLLPRGLEARQLHVRGRWLQIRLTTGETGWVHDSNVLRVPSWNSGVKVLQ